MKEVKFQIGELLGVGMTLVILAVGVAYGLDVLSDVSGDFDANSAEKNATLDGITGVSKITEKLPTLATVVMASVVIGVLITYLAGRFMR